MNGFWAYLWHIFPRLPTPFAHLDGVVIRTNSASTTLTINAEHDTIHHYDTLGALNIIKANTASYHENGKVAYAEISYGRIVLESGSKIEEVHVNKKDSASFDTVIIANNGGAAELPNRITRDAVTVTEETLVVKVESNGSRENVYVYADGTTGKTNKVTEGENLQNQNVNSALGQLVLDNGSNPGEKAQTPEQKSDAKNDTVQEAKYEEAQEKGNIIHVDEVPATCTENGKLAYDYYMDGEIKVIVGGLTEDDLIISAGHVVHTWNQAWYGADYYKYGHSATCSRCNKVVDDFCSDVNGDELCDVCGNSIIIGVNSSTDLLLNPDDQTDIIGQKYKLMADVVLQGQYYIKGDVVIDLNGHILEVNDANGAGPGSALFRAYGSLNCGITLKDSSASKSGKFVSRYGHVFFENSKVNQNYTFTINCEDNVIIDTTYNYVYEGNDSQQSFTSSNDFLNNPARNIVINNAHLIIGRIANMRSGYTATYNNCIIETRGTSVFSSNSGNIVFNNCTFIRNNGSSSEFNATGVVYNDCAFSFNPNNLAPNNNCVIQNTGVNNYYVMFDAASGWDNNRKTVGSFTVTRSGDSPNYNYSYKIAYGTFNFDPQQYVEGYIETQEYVQIGETELSEPAWWKWHINWADRSSSDYRIIETKKYTITIGDRLIEKIVRKEWHATVNHAKAASATDYQTSLTPDANSDLWQEQEPTIIYIVR